MSEKEMFLCDEVLILRDSGEIPEIAFHSTLYYLREDPEGPGLDLDEHDLARLKKPVVERYRWIIKRDIDPDNRGKAIWRGVARSMVNWQRLKDFGQRQGVYEAVEKLRPEIAAALIEYLAQELRDVQNNGESSINCSLAELASYAAELGLADDDLPTGWQTLCPADD